MVILTLPGGTFLSFLPLQYIRAGDRSTSSRRTDGLRGNYLYHLPHCA